MNNNLRTKAIVLRRVNYGEADRILTVLTPNNGIISVMARGARREKSRLAGGIELFSICVLNLVKGLRNHGDIWTLTGSRVEQNFYSIIDDFARMEFGYDAIKFVTKASSNIEESDYFDLLAGVFRSLSDAKIPLKVTEAWFYLNLAKIGGTELNIRTDKNGMKLLEDAHYDWDAQDQTFAFANSGKYDANHIKVLRILVSSSPVLVAKIADINKYIDDCLLVAKSVSKI
jgi:DNA repair protein RecO (recombination protein O)